MAYHNLFQEIVIEVFMELKNLSDHGVTTDK